MRQWRRAIYAMHSIDGVAGGLVGVFIPLYFLALGYSLTNIFAFFIVNNLAILILFFAAGWLASKFGIKKLLLIRLLFLFSQFYFLFNLKDFTWSFYLIAIFSAADIAFYWFSLNVIFTKSLDVNDSSKQVSNLSAIPQLFGLFVPLIGASITVLFGFKALFWLAGIVYFAGVMPMLFVGHIPVEVKISRQRIWEYCVRFKKYFMAEALLGASGEVEGYILPIFLFLTFHNALSIGIIAALLGLGSALFTLFVGHYSDRYDKKRILRAGVLAMFLVWIFRYLADTQIEFYVLSILAGFFGVLISVPFTSIAYKYAKETHVEDFTIFREIPISLGRILLYGMGIIFVAKIKWTFIVSAGASLLMLLF